MFISPFSKNDYDLPKTIGNNLLSAGLLVGGCASFIVLRNWIPDIPLPKSAALDTARKALPYVVFIPAAVSAMELRRRMKNLAAEISKPKPSIRKFFNAAAIEMMGGGIATLSAAVAANNWGNGEGFMLMGIPLAIGGAFVIYLHRTAQQCVTNGLHDIGWRAPPRPPVNRTPPRSMNPPRIDGGGGPKAA